MLDPHSAESGIERRSLGDQSNLLGTQKLRRNPPSRERKSQQRRRHFLSGGHQSRHSFLVCRLPVGTGALQKLLGGISERRNDGKHILFATEPSSNFLH